MSETDFKKIFESLTMPWFYSNPIFFKLFCMQKLVPNPIIPIPFRVGKNLIEYNPLIVGKKTRECLRNQLAIEIQRIILRHPFRRPEDDWNFDKELWYEASTMTITQKGVGCRGFKKHRDIEYYYKMLRNSDDEDSDDDDEDDGSGFKGNETDENQNGDGAEKFQNQNGRSSFFQEESDCEESNGASSDSTETKEEKNGGAQDDNSKTENASDDNSKSEETKAGCELWSCDDTEAEKSIDSFMKSNSTLWGTMSGNLEELLSLMAVKKARIPSCVRLLEYFKGLRNNKDYTLTRMRPSRRFGYAQMGKKRRPVPSKILVGVDVSGSITVEHVLKFYHAIANVFDKGIKYIDVFQFDSVLATEKPERFKEVSEIKIHGRGGTCFQPIFDYAIKNQRDYDGLIIFTDGDAAEPVIHHRFSTKVLWVLVDKVSYFDNQETLRKTGFVTVLV
jgi:predicted metal-dependent peptidase